jgi:hypothetical protein
MRREVRLGRETVADRPGAATVLATDALRALTDIYRARRDSEA